MAFWATCSLDEEILSIAEEDACVTVRQLCALIYPWLSWEMAQHHLAEVVRLHCQTLVRRRCLAEVRRDTYHVVQPALA